MEHIGGAFTICNQNFLFNSFGVVEQKHFIIIQDDKKIVKNILSGLEKLKQRS